MTAHTVIVHHPIPDQLRHHLQHAGYTPTTSTDHTTIYTNHASTITTPRLARAALYRAGAKTFLHSGLDPDGARLDREGDGLDPEGDGEAMLSPLVFMTLTAWSFVAVHRAGYSPDSRRAGPFRPCRPRARAPVCLQLRVRTCPHGHRLGQPSIGEAICPGCYGYRAAVTFNARAGELPQRTLIAAHRQLAGRADVPVLAFGAHWRISCVRVVGFRASGVVHLQALVRLERSDANPASSDANDLAAAAAATRAPTPSPLHTDRPIRWGTQAEAEITHAGARRKTVAYLAKYATNAEDGAGLLHRRLRSGNIDHLGLPDRVKGMVQGAWDLGGGPELKRLNLWAWAHSLGWRGHWPTRSAHWLTTFARRRASRRTWRLEQLGVTPEEAAGRWGEWDYQGSGYLNAGYAWLGANANRAAKLNRRIAWEET